MTEHPAAAGIARAFEPGAQARSGQVGDVTFWTRTVGNVSAPTGRIVACDPFACSDAPAFASEVPPGTYPVLVAIAQFDCSGGERIAAALLRLSDAPPVRWEPARWEGDPANATSEADDETRGASAVDDAAVTNAYCVDSGFGAFMDEAAIDALIEHIEAEDDDDYLQRRLDALRPAGGAEWFDIPLDEETGANIVLVTSGWGDGKYPCYWGYDTDGDLVCLLTDFGVVNDADFL
jgi:hypothetical protein